MNLWRGCQAGAGTSDLARQCLKRFACERNKVHDRGCVKESQVFDPKAYAVSPLDLIPDEAFEDDDDDLLRLEYCRIASTVDRTHLIEVVLSDLDADESPRFEFIDDAIANPHEPGRPKANITDLARLGQSLLNLIAKAIDDQLNLCRAVQEVPRD